MLYDHNFCKSLILLYVSELFDIIAEFGCTSHVYADDTQLCQPLHIRMRTSDSSAALNEFTIGWLEII